MRQEHRAGEKLFVDFPGQTIAITDPISGVITAGLPDNLRAGVTRAHRYEPGVNATYLEMATHYSAAVITGRGRNPRDKEVRS